MSTTKDIRTRREEGAGLKGPPLTIHWPFAPEGVDDARSSGLICATVVARAMWSRIKPQLWPERKDEEDAITTYTFADFELGLPWLAKSLPRIWERAKKSSLAQQDEQADDSFASICRSPSFVRAFWANPLFRLTTDHYRAGWAYDERHVVLGGEDLARRAVVAWNGVEPETLAEAVNSLTFKKEDDRKIITFAFFSSPMLLQVDFTPGDDSDMALADMQTFSADRWAFVSDPYGMGGGQWKVTGQVHYTIMAIVLHRESEDGVDSVRLFRENGREELPAGTCEANWPIDLYEPVPAGSKVTVFYNSILPDDKVHPLAPSERFPSRASGLDVEIKGQALGIPEVQGGAMAGDAELEGVLAGLSAWQPIEAKADSQLPPEDTQDNEQALERPTERSGRHDIPGRPSRRSQTSPIPDRHPSPRRNPPPPRNQQPDAHSNAPPNAPTGPRSQRSSWRPRDGPNAQPIPSDRLRLGGGPGPGMNSQVGNNAASRGGGGRSGRGGRGGR